APPGPGRAGRDGCGVSLPPVPGTPVAVAVGSGVTASANGRDFTAETEGRVIFRDGELSVSSVLAIGQDVDYSVGNIDFIGSVEVRGSLLDGFSITAKRGVTISGEVGAAKITSAGDVVISGGIRGKNAAIVSCRNLTARYIDDATVEASGNVVAAKEIMNSSVKALGRVSVTDGAIVGGEVCGLKGVEAVSIGSDLGVSTWVMAGLNWTDENKKEEIRGLIAEYQDRIQSSKILLDPLLADKEAMARLGSGQKSMLSELISELRYLRENMESLLSQRAGLDGLAAAGVAYRINARKMLYMGVSARIGEVDGQIQDNTPGPVSIVRNAGNNTIAVEAFSELPPLEAGPGGADGGSAGTADPVDGSANPAGGADASVAPADGIAAGAAEGE
ncbi:MAG: FapA family protein, partial [Planctomycetes bacterium]|nr:FapA family protein [Planctomycetota bacterium]